MVYTKPQSVGVDRARAIHTRAPNSKAILVVYIYPDRQKILTQGDFASHQKLRLRRDNAIIIQFHIRFFFKLWIAKLQKLDFLRREKEFEAQTFRIDSTHEYYKTTKFQLQTPSLSAPTGNPFFKNYQ